MKVLVLRAFPYSDNGLTTTVLPVGWEGEIRDDLAPGLVKEGYIAECTMAAATGDDNLTPATDAAIGGKRGRRRKH